MTEMDRLDHPALRLLRQYRYWGMGGGTGGILGKGVYRGRASTSAGPWSLSFHNDPCPFSQVIVFFGGGKFLVGIDYLLGR